MLRLIGGLQINPAEDDHSLIKAMFKRLPDEMVKGGNLFPKDIVRFIGYESAGDFPDKVRFFGMEVDEINFIPEGLQAWELDPGSFTIRRSDDGRPCPAWWEEIKWKWLERPELDSAQNDGRQSIGPQCIGRQCIGEFSARGMAEWWMDEPAGVRPFELFAHVPFDLNKGAFDDEVFLVDPDPTWPQQFEEMAAWLREQLGPDIALNVAHYGSTAIPGIPAKPIIDLLVEVPTFTSGKQRAFTVLNDPNWEFWLYAGHMVLFKRESCMGRRTHHVHLAPAGHDLWKGQRFRDYLRAHPQDAARYAALKRQLAQAYRDDRERYTRMKTDFVEEINRKALKE